VNSGLGKRRLDELHASAESEQKPKKREEKADEGVVRSAMKDEPKLYEHNAPPILHRGTGRQCKIRRGCLKRQLPEQLL